MSYGQWILRRYKWQYLMLKVQDACNAVARKQKQNKTQNKTKKKKKTTKIYVYINKANVANFLKSLREGLPRWRSG